MTTNKNELSGEHKVAMSSMYGETTQAPSIYNTQNGEIKQGDILVKETAKYDVYKLQDGTFEKRMKYAQYFSRMAETEEEQIHLYNVFNDSESKLVTPLKNMVNSVLTVKHVFIQPYESFNEKNGETTNGVTTTIEDVDGSYYATSSKSVYYSILGMFETFGRPSDENYKPLKVKVLGIKRENNRIQIDLEIIGKVE